LERGVERASADGQAEHLGQQAAEAAVADGVGEAQIHRHRHESLNGARRGHVNCSEIPRSTRCQPGGLSRYNVGAYWLMWSFRKLMPRRSWWRAAQFDTLRLRLIKIAARVEEMKMQVRLHLPRSMPAQAVFGLVLSRMPKLVI